MYTFAITTKLLLSKLVTLREVMITFLKILCHKCLIKTEKKLQKYTMTIKKQKQNTKYNKCTKTQVMINILNIITWHN